MVTVAMKLSAGDVLCIGLHSLRFSSYFPAFFRTKFTLPCCPEREKVFTFDYFVTSHTIKLPYLFYLSGFRAIL